MKPDYSWLEHMDKSAKALMARLPLYLAAPVWVLYLGALLCMVVLQFALAGGSILLIIWLVDLLKHWLKG